MHEIDQLMKSQKKKQKDLNEFLGLPHNTYDNWKRGLSGAFMKYIDRIGEYLNVSPNYLICGVDDIAVKDDKRKQFEARLKDIIRSIPEKEASRLMTLVEAYVSTI